jgi:hypothetical protein
MQTALLYLRMGSSLGSFGDIKDVLGATSWEFINLPKDNLSRGIMGRGVSSMKSY